MLKIKVFEGQNTTPIQTVDWTIANPVYSEFLVGRLPDCNLVLPSAEVSRHHCKLIVRSGLYTCVDLGSRGGTYLNEAPLTPQQQHPLQPGNVLRIADYRLEITAQASAFLTTVIVQPEQTASPALQTALPPERYMPVACLAADQIQRWVKGDLTVHCSRIIEETPDVKTFCFVTDPPLLFTYKPGQFITLHLEINGEEVLRSYSISSSPSRPHILEITVKRVAAPKETPQVSPGLVSNWLHDTLTVGSQLKISGPLGKFSCFTNPARKLLLISAGSGITPMMSMARWIYDTAADCDVIFLHSARSPDDIIFQQELEMMARRQPNFQLALTMTQADSRQGWFGLTGRISAAILQSIASDFRERTVYVCGPEGFMAGIKTLMQELQFPMQHYYEESFGAPKKRKKTAKQPAASPGLVDIAPKPSPGFGLGAALKGLQNHGNNWLQPVPAPVGQNALTDSHAEANESEQSAGKSNVAVVFNQSGKTIPCADDECILDIAEQAGIKIRSSCRAGSCGSCKKRKLEGEVRLEDYDPEALPPEERETGFILTCVSYPLGRVVVDA